MAQSLYSYPVRIGKHIVCIYKQLVGVRFKIKTNKTKVIAMRFRESDYAAIKKKSTKVNMNFTEFVTLSALNKPIVIVEGLSEVLKEQKAIGRNINQLTTLCNMGKITCPDLQEVKQKYTEMVAVLNEIVRRCC